MSKPLLVIIDDELEVAEFVGEVGESVGFDVNITTTSSDFQEALMNQNPSLIVMDIVMPDMDGIELIEWMSQQQLSVPLIIISGYSGYIHMTETLAEKKGLTILGSLAKPFPVEDINSLLQKFIETL